MGQGTPLRCATPLNANHGRAELKVARGAIFHASNGVKHGRMAALGEELADARRRPIRALTDAPYGLVPSRGDHVYSLAAEDVFDRYVDPLSCVHPPRTARRPSAQGRAERALRRPLVDNGGDSGRKSSPGLLSLPSLIEEPGSLAVGARTEDGRRRGQRPSG